MIRQAARPNRGRMRVDTGLSIPAPTGGWDAVSPIADMKEDRALVLENWFPTPTDIRVRRGHQVHTTTLGSIPVPTLMVYHGVVSTDSRMFAVAGGDIWDVSTSGAPVSTTETGLGSDRLQYVNFTTSGGNFLWFCNGADAPRHYNGSVWATPSITGITPSDVINVNAHKNRLWLVLKDSTKAAYLPTGAIAGAATEFELGGLMTKGGYLVAMATWTRDGGLGPDDLAVFISSRGQVIVYQGTDPASANTWALIGVYDAGPPIGRRCFHKVGGDLALLNVDGVLPLSAVLNLDRAVQNTVAITRNINNAMNEAARLYKSNFGWELTAYAQGTMAILNVPITQGVLQHQYVMNTITGAWCKFTGMNASTWAVFNDNLYFGGNDGIVYRADHSANDVDEQISAIGQGAYNYYKSRGRLKSWKMIQPLMTVDTDAIPSVGISTDFRDNVSIRTPTTSTFNAAHYDEAIYDTDVYAFGERTVADWEVALGVGQCASIHFRALSGLEGGGDTSDIALRLNGFNVIYEVGGFL